jgi:hypothetical protein
MFVASRKFNDSGKVYEAGDSVDVSPARAEYLLSRNFIHDPSTKPADAEETAESAEPDATGKKGKK